jgi:hypothetical protein
MEALPIAEGIQRYAAGQRIRRLTLFEHLERSADSSTSKHLVTNSGQYGLTRGSYMAEYLELTDEGKLASGDESLGRARLAARLQLAIEKITPFKALYEEFKSGRLPSPSVLRDFLVDRELAAEDTADECVQTFLANARDLGVLKNYAGAERLLTFEVVLEETATAATPDHGDGAAPPVVGAGPSPLSPAAIVAGASDLSEVCFLISPIGDEGSEQRKHADLVMGSLVEPALDGFGLRLVRADRISKPGVITAQVIEHLVKCPLLVADLSYGNPNVFYELALRHATRRPVVQIIRAADRLPFDVGQFRTVVLDMTDIFTLVPQIETYRGEIARQCRAALDGDGPADSPLSLFYPKFWDVFAILRTRKVANQQEAHSE